MEKFRKLKFNDATYMVFTQKALDHLFSFDKKLLLDRLIVNSYAEVIIYNNVVFKNRNSCDVNLIDARFLNLETEHFWDVYYKYKEEE